LVWEAASLPEWKLGSRKTSSVVEIVTENTSLCVTVICV
jgi:hypothetical protein